jgi:hypothetical protein
MFEVVEDLVRQRDELEAELTRVEIQDLKLAYTLEMVLLSILAGGGIVASWVCHEVLPWV